MSIADKFLKGVNEFPIFQVPVKFDDEFILASAVETKKYAIDFTRGIHIGPFYYWSPRLIELKGHKTSTDVRIDPENPHLIFARCLNKWEPCWTSLANRFSALDPITQRCEVLKYVESHNSKSLIAREADEQLVKKIREMDVFAQQESTPFMQIEACTKSEDGQPQDSIFSQLAAADIAPLSVENWQEGKQ